MAPERRKRTHPQVDKDEAETSTAKKQRVNSVAKTLPPAAIKGAYLPRRRGNVRGSWSNSQQNGVNKSVYDVPGSSDDEGVIVSQLSSFRPAIKQIKARPGVPRLVQEAAQDVYDVPDSGDELESPAHANGKTQVNGTLKSTVSPRKTRVTRRRPGARNGDDQESQDETWMAETPSRRQTRLRTVSKNSDIDEASDFRDNDVAETAPGARRDRQQLEESVKEQRKMPKGILTPRHKKSGRPRKSVAFDNQSETRTTEVYFEDIPSEAKTTQPSAAKKGARFDLKTAKLDNKNEDEDESDDEICVICSKADSKPRNQIIFCDSCNKAVHQKCYNVPVIPKDDWFCNECLREDVASSVTDDTAKPQDQESASNTPDIPNFAHHLQRLQRVLIDRCSGNRRIKLKGQDEAFEKAFQLVEQTVLAGEGNSMMIIGARGCGKTTLVDSIISDLSADSKESFHVVRLNGFIHTDDKLALKEIWRQLGKEMDLEDDLVNKTSNYADTLASLLALLSHPSEITGTEEGLTSKSVVFVIDEFDLFATHARQTLLYNLFDIAQARKAPIAVLGLTTRIDVVESLEKRVKSRFSHRYVHLSLPKSLPAYWDICKQGLTVDEEDLESEGFDTSLEGIDEFREYWDTHIETLRKTRSFQDHLEYHFTTTKSVSSFFTTCILPLSALSMASPTLKIEQSWPASLSIEAPDSKLHLLAALSDLDLALLIAAARLDIVAHTDTVNFAMAYDEYSSQMGKQRVQSAGSGMLALGASGRVWGRDVAGTAWERLVSLGLLIPAGIGGRSNAAHGGLEGKMWKLDVCLEEIPAAVELPGFLQKWCTQL